MFSTTLDVNGGLLAGPSTLLDSSRNSTYELHVYDTEGLFTGAPDPATLNRSQPEPLMTFRPQQGAAGENSGFGGSLRNAYMGDTVLSGRHVLVGSPLTGPLSSDTPLGAVHVFGPVPGAPVRDSTLTAPPVTYGQPSRAVAATDQTGADGGTVTFKTEALASGPVTVAGHSAAWETGAGVLDAGEHEVTTVFTPPERSGAPITVHASHEIAQASTTVTVEADPPKPVSGAEVRLAGTVKGEHGTAPTGSVKVTRDGAPIATAELDAAGAYTVSVKTSLAPADSEMTVSYPGDTNHVASQGSVVFQATPPPSSPPPTCEPPSPGGTPPPCGATPPGGHGGATPPGAKPRTLPFTGTSSLWIALGAACLVGAGLALRRHRRLN
jgi:hypothetical protein